MAGIGFRLRKIFEKDTYADTLRGTVMAAAIAGGPNVPLEPRRTDTLARRLPLQQVEPDVGRGSHLDGGDAHLPIPLGKMAISGGEEGPAHRDRQQQFRPAGQLFDVEVASVLTGRYCAKARGGCGSSGWHRIFGIGWENQSSPIQQLLLAQSPSLDLISRRRHA